MISLTVDKRASVHRGGRDMRKRLKETDIVRLITTEFKCFGSGTLSDPSNPLSHWTAERPPMFAMGVDVASVVHRVLELARLATHQPAEPT